MAQRAGVAVIDHDLGAERLAADRAAAALGQDRRGDLGLRESLTFGGRLARIGGTERPLGTLAERCGAAGRDRDTHLSRGEVRKRPDRNWSWPRPPAA